PQVLFTGVVASPEMEVALRTLGGSLATSVLDCTHLVTDRVRRTIKFLCAVARGVPIVTPEWLLKVRRGGTLGTWRDLGDMEGPWGQGGSWAHGWLWGQGEGLGDKEKVLGDKEGTLGTMGGIFGDKEATLRTWGQGEGPWGQGGDLGDNGWDLWGQG
ncbi:MDC1 protein, partial [Baryphthengus martii]|nr:MDC1 protein [Baryphthengus martii]